MMRSHGQLFLLLQRCLLNSHTPLMIVHLAKTNLIYIHSGHKIQSDCFRNMHINSAISTVHILLKNLPTTDYNTCPQVILPRHLVMLLPRIQYPVMDILFFTAKCSESVILITVLYPCPASVIYAVLFCSSR